MCLFQKESIKEYANSIGITDLPDKVSSLLSNDVEYRLREIIQDASKFMMHSKRDKMTVDDINKAFEMKNIEPIYGYDPKDPFNFVSMEVEKQDGKKTVFYVPEKTVNLLEYLTTPPEPFPAYEGIASHWIAIEGVQPKIPENDVQEKKFEESFEQENVFKPCGREEVKEAAIKKPLIQHNLSKEMQLYFDTVEECILSKNKQKEKIVFEAIRGDAGIQQLVPYFTQLITDVVTKNLRDLHILSTAMDFAESLLKNKHIHIEPYLHQLIPPVLTCVVGKTLCADPLVENHWLLREKSSKISSFICNLYGNAYHTLKPRIVQTLLKAFHDKTKPLTTHYGAIYGLSCFSKSVVNSLIKHIKEYCLWLNYKKEKENLYKKKIFNLLFSLFKEWKEDNKNLLDEKEREERLKLEKNLEAIFEDD